jgi:protein O-GlcNAc transferase
MATTAELLELALRYHHGGDLRNAERHYRQVLAAEPNNAVAHVNLGIVMAATGRRQEAAHCFQKSIAAQPNLAEAHYHLGNVLCAGGEAAQAIRCYRQALALNPNLGPAHASLGLALVSQGQMCEAASCFLRAARLDPHDANGHYNLGTALKELGRPAQAAECYRQTLRCNPEHQDAHVNLGNVLLSLGTPAEAEESYRQALRLNPQHPDALTNLGVLLAEKHQNDEANACFRQALRADPQHPHALFHLGNHLKDQGQWTQAEDCYRHALHRNPNQADACNNLGIVLFRQGRLDEAAVCYRQALRINPAHGDALGNLGIICKELGNLEEAADCFRRAMELRPDDAAAHANLIYLLHYCPGQDAPTILKECRRWTECHAKPLAKFRAPHSNERLPERRLRIGYVSSDLREHPVGRFLLPLLRHHDHTPFEILCYADVEAPDAITEECRRLADQWRPIAGLADEKVAQLIRDDGIDILVDLAMHTGNNRLLVFARKPAPVQVTYLAYCGTTGLDTIDYRLTDPFFDPPGESDANYSEKSIRLPTTYWCYQPMLATPDVSPPPSLTTGFVTFGCLNNFCKVSQPTLECWRRILCELPNSRLLLHVPAGSAQARLHAFFAQGGIAPERLQFVERVAAEPYFRTYERIDIALDPFPFGGGTTTCDALWMGVPVITLAGQTAVGRGGVSIMSNLGLTDWIATNVDDYVHLAVAKAMGLSALDVLRRSLRQRMQSSPLMDAAGFARDIENAFRTMWRQWCAV